MKKFILMAVLFVACINAPVFAQIEKAEVPPKHRVLVKPGIDKAALQKMRRATPKLAQNKAEPIEIKDPALHTKLRIYIVNDARKGSLLRLQPNLFEAICKQAIQITITDSEGGFYDYEGKYHPADGDKSIVGFATQSTMDIHGDGLCFAQVTLPNDRDLKVGVRVWSKEEYIFMDAGAFGSSPIEIEKTGVYIAPKMRPINLTDRDYGAQSAYFYIQQIVPSGK